MFRSSDHTHFSNAETNDTPISKPGKDLHHTISSTLPQRTSPAIFTTGDKNLPNPPALCLHGNGSGYPTHQRGIPRRSQRNRLGEAKAAISHQTMQGFFKENEPGYPSLVSLHEIFLDGVDLPAVSMAVGKGKIS